MKIEASFTNKGTPATGLSATIRIRELPATLVVTDEAMSESGDGTYFYDYTGYDVTKDYAIRCDGGVTLQDTDRYKFAGNESYYEDVAHSVWSDSLTNYTSGAGRNQQLQSFAGQIIYDADNGFAGTKFPIGTIMKPSNNLTDLLTISNFNNISNIQVKSDLTVAAGQNVSRMSLETHGIMGTDIILSPGCSTKNTLIRYANLSGEITNGDTLLIESCQVGELENFTGIMNVVSFSQGSEISCGDWANFIGCHSGGDPGNEPELNIGNADVNINKYTGNLKLTNKTGANRTVANFQSGNVIVDSTCVSGTIQILGTGTIEKDNSGPNCKVDIDGFISKNAISSAVWDEPLISHTNPETTGDALLQQSYNNKVYIDIINGGPGTVYPAGIKESPVNSINDALAVSSLYELSNIHVIGSLTISGGEDLSGYTFVSDRSLGNSINLVNYISDYVYFNDLTVSGTLNGYTRFTYCVLGSLTNMDGGIKNSLITGDISFTGTSNNYMTDCDRFISDPNTYINLDIGDCAFNMIRGRGNYKILGKTSTDITSLDLNGAIYIDSTCISGTIVPAGLVRIIDESGPGCIVIQAGLTNNSIADHVWNEDVSSHTVSGSFSDMLQRTVSLMHENIFIDNPIYDGFGNLTTARVRIYSVPGSVGTANDVIGTYEINSAAGVEAGKFTSWSQIKV